MFACLRGAGVCVLPFARGIAPSGHEAQILCCISSVHGYDGCGWLSEVVQRIFCCMLTLSSAYQNGTQGAAECNQLVNWFYMEAKDKGS